MEDEFILAFLYFSYFTLVSLKMLHWLTRYDASETSQNLLEALITHLLPYILNVRPHGHMEKFSTSFISVFVTFDRVTTFEQVSIASGNTIAGSDAFVSGLGLEISQYSV